MLLSTTAPLPQGALSQLGWIDITALCVLLVFLVWGFFRGFFWQLTRIVTIVVGIHLAGRYAGTVEPNIADWFSESTRQANLPFYVAYFLVFLGVLIALSLVALLIEKLIRRTGLSFYDRLSGGLLGIGTGAVAVLALLIAVFCLFPNNGTVVQAAESSKALEYSKKGLQSLRGVIPEKWIPNGVRDRFGLPTDAQLELEKSEGRPPPK